MKYFLDEQGNVIEKPETLQESLRQKSPELADSLIETTNKIALLKMYQFFLYNHPSEEELNLPGKRGPNWEKFIQIVGSQQGLENTINALEHLKNDNLDVQDDKVVVVRSDRPFWDTLLNKEHILGKCEGWIGEVESHDITDIPDAKFYSQDGKIYHRFVLKNAKRLTRKELGECASSAMLVMMNHRYNDSAKSFADKMKDKKLGDKRVVIYDEYQNIDYFIAEHKLSDIEKQVSDISYEEARWIDLKPFYGERQIPDSQLIVGRQYEDSNKNYTEFILTAIDSRKLSEIWKQIQKPLEILVKEKIKTNNKLESVNIALFRYVNNLMTPEQKEFAKNAPGGDSIKWFKKYIDEQGLEITNKTAIVVSPWVLRSLNVNIQKEIFELIRPLLPEYTPEEAYLNYSWNDRLNENEQMRAETTYDFEWNPILYAGELMILSKYHFEEKERDKQRMEERMHLFEKK